MRAGACLVAMLLPLMVACKLLPQGIDQPAPETTTEVSAAAESGTENPPGGLRPKPRPVSAESQVAPEGDLSAAAPAPPSEVSDDVAIRKSKDQVACERKKGNWVNVGKSQSKTCVKQTRDAGKQCRKQGDCESACLARSGTCAPVKPLFGCNEIFQKDGSRVTLCID